MEETEVKCDTYWPAPLGNSLFQANTYDLVCYSSYQMLINPRLMQTCSLVERMDQMSPLSTLLESQPSFENGSLLSLAIKNELYFTNFRFSLICQRRSLLASAHAHAFSGRTRGPVGGDWEPGQWQKWGPQQAGLGMAALRKDAWMGSRFVTPELATGSLCGVLLR